MSDHRDVPVTFPCSRDGPLPAPVLQAGRQFAQTLNAGGRAIASVASIGIVAANARSHAAHAMLATSAPLWSIKPPFGVSRNEWNAKQEALVQEQAEITQRMERVFERCRRVANAAEAAPGIAECKADSKRLAHLNIAIQLGHYLHRCSPDIKNGREEIARGWLLVVFGSEDTQRHLEETLAAATQHSPAAWGYSQVYQLAYDMQQQGLALADRLRSNTTLLALGRQYGCVPLDPVVG